MSQFAQRFVRRLGNLTPFAVICREFAVIRCEFALIRCEFALIRCESAVIFSAYQSFPRFPVSFESLRDFCVGSVIFSESM
jgi:hypothetical protein